MMANSDQFQSVTLGLTDLDFALDIDSVKIESPDKIDSLGVNIDASL